MTGEPWVVLGGDAITAAAEGVSNAAEEVNAVGACGRKGRHHVTSRRTLTLADHALIAGAVGVPGAATIAAEFVNAVCEHEGDGFHHSTGQPTVTARFAEIERVGAVRECCDGRRTDGEEAFRGASLADGCGREARSGIG